MLPVVPSLICWPEVAAAVEAVAVWAVAALGAAAVAAASVGAAVDQEAAVAASAVAALGAEVVAAASVAVAVLAAALTVRGEVFLAAALAPLIAARADLARLVVASIAVGVLPPVAGAIAPTQGPALALP
jgi:hypothetical protein